ncbi:MAG: P-II family nitrogen regulator [Thermoplasmata archaeon]|nr:P-II family nitrogen regulator [Thermoplasmata archaeon]
MKMIIAIVRPERLQCVKDGLSKIGVNGVTITHVTGRGEQMGLVFTTRVGEFVVDEIEKVKLDIVVEDDQVDAVIAKIREKAETGHPGDGRIFVLPVEQSLKIRTETETPAE